MKRYDYELIGPVSCVDAAYIDMSAPCVPWTKACTRGHGVLKIDGKNQYAYRVEYARSRGVSIESLKGVKVRHVCDNANCVNFAHLICGSQADNVTDMARRKRRNDAHGERSPKAVLTEQDVLKIVSLYRKGCPTHGAEPLAREFGVSHGAINSIVWGVTWRHITRPLAAP